MAFNVSWKLTIVAILLVLTTWPACEATTRGVLEALMVERHETWMAQHGRTYKDAAEKAQRLKIFKDNVERIESFNKAGGRTYKLGVNKFADLTKEEILASRTGYKMSSSSRRYTTSFRYANVTQVPYSVDWREMGAVVGVKNQLQCNSCWAFSSVAAIEGIYQINTGKLISLSEQELVDCEEIDRGCIKGGFMDRAFDFIIANGGITEESQYPYLGSDEACNWMKRLSPAVTITGYEYVPTNSESALLKAVANQPVSVGISIAGNFESYASGVYTGEYCGTKITHAVTVVGYGTTSDGIKYWLLKNSWGETWGENGYMRLQRDVDAVEGACGIAIVPLYPTV